MGRCPIDFPTCHRETEKKCPTFDIHGFPICWLGIQPQVYQLKPRADGNIDLTLSLTHRKFLIWLADERQGETEYNWDHPDLKEETKEHMRCLIDMRLIQETPIIGYEKKVLFRLTDMGRNIVTQIKKAES